MTAPTVDLTTRPIGREIRCGAGHVRTTRRAECDYPDCWNRDRVTVEVTYCIVQHSSGERGGYVVRTLDADRDKLAAPYANATILEVYADRRKAQARSDALTFGPGRLDAPPAQRMI